VPLDALDVDRYEQIFGALEARAREHLRAEGFADDAIRTSRTAEIRFAGQWFELGIPVPTAPDSLDEVERLFRAAHLERYGVDMDRPIEFVNFRVSGRGLVDKPDLTRAPDGEREAAASSCRNVYIDGDLRELPVYERSALGTGATIGGPAVVEEFGSTTVVAPGFSCRAHELGALVLTAEDGPA
jgi:N-methylhydantoinase A